MKNKVFILSTGRSGTNYLTKKIDALNLVTNNLHQGNMSRRINILSNIALKHPKINSLLVNKLQRNPEMLNNFIDPLKSLAFFYYLKDLKQNSPESFKDVTIIHLVRDPRDFVRSFMNWKDRKLSGKIAHNLVPYWMPKPKNNFLKNLNMSKFEHYCWTWEIKNELFHNTFHDIDNYILVRFEDMINNEDVLLRILNKVSGVEISKIQLSKNDTTKVNSTKNKSFPDWKEWNNKQSQLLHSICGEQMELYQYGLEDEWQEKLKNEK